MRLIMVPGTLCDQRLFAAVTRRLRPAVCVRVARWRELFGHSRPAWWDAQEPLNLLGFSLGGIWALQRLAQTVPSRAPLKAPLARLALLGSNAEAASTPVRRRARAQRRLLQRQGPAAVARAAKSGYFARRPQPWQARLLVQMARSTPRGLARRQLALAAQRADGLEAFRHFPGPVAVFYGHEDRLCPPPLQKRLQAARQDALTKAMNRCGHMIPLEAPGRLAQAIRRWLAQPAGGLAQGLPPPPTPIDR
ncbi:MAG: alpha/beta fold hydrolase [Burkholderiaceae bacterium]